MKLSPPKLFSLLQISRPKRTRYFVFTRVNPRDHDYDLLIDMCQKHDFMLAYKTVRDGWKIRLHGMLVMRGPPTVADDIMNLLPNFMVTPLSEEFTDGIDWVCSIQSGEGHFFIDGEILFNGKEHPFVDVKRSLFSDYTG